MRLADRFLDIVDVYLVHIGLKEEGEEWTQVVEGASDAEGNKMNG